jgi:hypothetical protein
VGWVARKEHGALGPWSGMARLCPHVVYKKIVAEEKENGVKRTTRRLISRQRLRDRWI